VEQLIAWARHGPRGARVDRVDVTWPGTGGAGWTDFDVRS
jgi:hypothetical protein